MTMRSDRVCPPITFTFPMVGVVEKIVLTVPREVFGDVTVEELQADLDAIADEIDAERDES